MPGQRLSSEMRRGIVFWRYQLNHTIDEITILADCAHSTVYEVLRYHRDYGEVNNPNTRQPGRPRSLEISDVNYISSLLEANPALYLDEIQGKLAEDRDLDVSISTISRCLCRLALTHKKIAKTALERNELLRATWQAAYGNILLEYFVWLDEASVDDHTNQRDGGWTALGRACVRRATFFRGQRFSVLPALTFEGIVALDIFEGSVTKERFTDFIRRQLAPKLTPYPGPRSVVVMDNCAIHHDEEIRHIIKVECGAKLIYLPPYSPDYNPIEQAFHSIKAWLRRHEAEALNADARPWLIHQAALAITNEDAEGWIWNCGYS